MYYFRKEQTLGCLYGVSQSTSNIKHKCSHKTTDKNKNVIKIVLMMQSQLMHLETKLSL